ncbi:MAG: hypothetical protein FVQ83_10660 [Chloroflexi bacterium]|nr:hypothetical protein [Chloroflexota bacterium]
MKIKVFLTLIIILFILPEITVSAQSDEEELKLSLSRDFGFGGFGGDIQGTFSMRVSGPDDLVFVEFYIDGQLVGSDDEEPFSYQFNTDAYEPGVHSMHAVGFTAADEEIVSNQIRRDFLSGEDAFGSIIKMLVPILGIIILITLIGVIGPIVFNRGGKDFQHGKYSRAAGGAVCPRCQLPYSRSMLSPNLIIGKLQRCPHCGKLAIVRAASASDLEAAEARLLQDSQEGSLQPEESEEERLQRMIDASRFED